MMRKIYTLLFLVLALGASSQNIIPQPQSIIKSSENIYSVGKTTVNIDAKLLPEQYVLTTNKGNVTIKAGSNQAVVWAKNTLAQLVVDNKVGEYKINDYPTFNIRAFMYDTGRNFVEIDLIKQFIDLASFYKLNAFHWHLTDNPAWRIESKIYPQLNDPKFQRKGRDEGRFYTYDQIREVIKYAKERGVMIIPEIDMPGHSKFFNDTFGFSMDSKAGMDVLERCLEEFFTEISVEDCPYFHIGSDEVHIADPKGFMAWAEALVAKYNRKAIAWNPGLPTSNSTIRQIWNSDAESNKALIEDGGAYLDSFMGYLNFYDPILFVSKMIMHNPCAVGYGSERALGGILCLWNDVRVTDKSRLIPHNGVLGGVMAFSERFWKGGTIGHDDVTTLYPNPKSNAGKALAEFEKRALWHKNHFVKSDDMKWLPNSNIEWVVSEPVEMGRDTINLKWNKAWGGVVDVDAFCIKHNFNIKVDSMVIYSRNKIESRKDTVIRAMVGFEVSARSNRKGNGIGKQGQWECDAKIKLNGKFIAPPFQWNEPGRYNYPFHTWAKPQEEEPFTDEQLYWMRQPIELHLKKGTNIIEITSPKWFVNQNWTFTFIPF